MTDEKILLQLLNGYHLSNAEAARAKQLIYILQTNLNTTL